MHLSRDDIATLKELRANFLETNHRVSDYWTDQRRLDLYDRFFAERIRWKWQSVLNEVKTRGYVPPKDCNLLDWGCGSGVAADSFLQFWSPEHFRSVSLFDRSRMAETYTAQKLSTQHGIPTEKWRGNIKSPFILLISHTLGEIGRKEQADILSLILQSESCFLIEPGTYFHSRRITEMREAIRSKMDILAPCTHQERCGLHCQSNERHWCHFFASPPPTAFQQADWSAFGRALGIDLRSLPVSFLVAQRKSTSRSAGNAVIIGRPRISKRHWTAQLCSSSGVSEVKEHCDKATYQSIKNTFILQLHNH
ncbi:MAG: hypothetical protein HY537_05780 [Deltaproteobacteria bacterium]|nr:hypothetical protein [Deltaproteobacteria bacterium]